MNIHHGADWMFRAQSQQHKCYLTVNDKKLDENETENDTYKMSNLLLDMGTLKCFAIFTEIRMRE